jgi:shikimate dehydrogenase
VRPPITGRTRLAGVIGDPVRHSLSPALLNAAFDATGLDWVYLAFPVPAGSVPVALAAMRALDIGGLSVTMPHKAAVAAACDVLSPAAAALGAVNCIVNDGMRLVGHNTDGPGLVDALGVDEGVTVEGRRCVIIGAGGAARAVVRAFADAGAIDIAIINRSPEPAAVAAALAGRAGRVATPEAIAGADVLVNATPLGMGADTRLPVDTGLLRAHHVVVDLVYHPLQTPLLTAASALGAHAVNGLGMLVHQAGHAFRLWTGRPPPIAVMREAAEKELARRSQVAS